MKWFSNILFTLLSMLLLTACATKEYEKQESVFILFKTPGFKYADLGFIYENPKETKVEIYSNGQAAMALTIDQLNVCMSMFECMSKKDFNQHILNPMYPETILENIFKGQMIFGGHNMVKTRNGFTQEIIKTDQYHINYTVLNKQILFHDTINNILIKVKRMGI